MYTVRVEADFAAAHFLKDYHGKCENLHGHNYRVRLWARGKDLDGGGMLLDFALLKNRLREVCSALDHSNLNEHPAFGDNPSAERIARHVFRECSRALSPEAAALLWAADVYETPGSMARYERDG
ncbi:MAG: 6-carboxytetrahydropterin synthase QueD [Treponema sp.]|jgi:6-pyruvoyltetrahydropterin/6-carboxytetrahydropterin synthase|nr:6-carboxytetrahydropterin synthase QueD [Treponema sp.]